MNRLPWNYLVTPKLIPRNVIYFLEQLSSEIHFNLEIQIAIVLQGP